MNGGIQNIIISYLNLHEIYLKELKDKIKLINHNSNILQKIYKDLQHTSWVVIFGEGKWLISYPYFSSKNKLNYKWYLKNKKRLREESKVKINKYIFFWIILSIIKMILIYKYQ